jgi:transposase
MFLLMEINDFIKETYATIAPHLNEKQLRLLAAAEAKVLGYGGVTTIATLTNLSRPTITKALNELSEITEANIDARIRRPGGGRKKTKDTDPELVVLLEHLVEPETSGAPMSPLRWTCKSTRQLSRILTEAGHPISHKVVAELLKEQGYSLQANRKTLEGGDHPDRDDQFRYINKQASTFLNQGLPVISVDTKKKELVGQYMNGGKEWNPSGNPVNVNVYDFINPEVGKAIPYGIYDIARNSGWVNVGCDHDTSAFAVESIRRWWNTMGSNLYPNASKLLICADGGGSNGSWVRLWKFELQSFCDETGLEVTIAHFPPGTSKWNKIEHRLFSHISMNWRGRPLISHEVVVDLISATTTQKGLTVSAQLDKDTYPLKIKVSDEQMAQLNLHRHLFHGDWNYTVRPRESQ